MAAKWCDAVERMRKADQSRRGFRTEARKTTAYFRACGESAAANDALVALAEERLTTLCSELPGYGITKKDARLGDGTAVFGQYRNTYVLTGFHMKHFRKGVFRSFGACVSWLTKDLKIGKRERRLAKTRFRLSRCYFDNEEKLNKLTHDSILASPDYYDDEHNITIPASLLFTAEFGKEAARLVLFYSEEFRGLPKEIKQLILRKLY